MKAIYTWHSYKRNKWVSKEFEILTLITSLKKTLTFFKDVELYTDFDSFQELLNRVPSKVNVIIKERVDHNLWVLDKVNTYLVQKEPFIHIDSDFIFLTKPNYNFLNCKMGFQSIDLFLEEIGNCYKPRIYNLLQNNAPINNNADHAYNFGVYVCNDLNLNKIYCDKVYRLSEFVLKNIESHLAYNIVVEQYIMSCLLQTVSIKPLLLIDFLKIDLDFIHLMHNKSNVNYYNLIKNLYE